MEFTPGAPNRLLEKLIKFRKRLRHLIQIRSVVDLHRSVVMYHRRFHGEVGRSRIRCFSQVVISVLRRPRHHVLSHVLSLCCEGHTTMCYLMCYLCVEKATPPCVISCVISVLRRPRHHVLSLCWEGHATMCYLMCYLCVEKATPPCCHELWDPLSCRPALEVMTSCATVVGVNVQSTCCTCTGASAGNLRGVAIKPG